MRQPYQQQREQMRTLRRELDKLKILNAPKGTDVIAVKTLNLEELREIKDTGIPVYVSISLDEGFTTLKPSSQFHYCVQSRKKIIDRGRL
jgi:hypothetical protein